MSRDTERGATMVEMAIVTVATWFLLTALFDFARYLVTLTILTFGAQEALLAARSAYDLADCAYDSGTGATVCGAAVNTTVTALENLAKDVPLASIVAETAGAAQELELVSVIVPGIAGSTHPDPGCGELSNASNSIGNVFNSCPIIVELAASVQFMTPGLGRKDFLVRVTGFRERAMNEKVAFPEAEFFPL